MDLKNNKTPTLDLYTTEFIDERKGWLNARHEAKKNELAMCDESEMEAIKLNIILIEFALKRIDHKQYGLCTNCGVPIEPEKLDLMPETPICSYCSNRRSS